MPVSQSYLFPISLLPFKLPGLVFRNIFLILPLYPAHPLDSPPTILHNSTQFQHPLVPNCYFPYHPLKCQAAPVLGSPHSDGSSPRLPTPSSPGSSCPSNRLPPPGSFLPSKHSFPVSTFYPIPPAHSPNAPLVPPAPIFTNISLTTLDPFFQHTHQRKTPPHWTPLRVLHLSPFSGFRSLASLHPNLLPKSRSPGPGPSPHSVT